MQQVFYSIPFVTKIQQIQVCAVKRKIIPPLVTNMGLLVMEQVVMTFSNLLQF